MIFGKSELFKFLTTDVFDLLAQENLIYALQYHHVDFNCVAKNYMDFVEISLSPDHSKHIHHELYWSLDTNFESILIGKAMN